MPKSVMGAAPVMESVADGGSLYGGGEAASVWMKHAGGSGGYGVAVNAAEAEVYRCGK